MSSLSNYISCVEVYKTYNLTPLLLLSIMRKYFVPVYYDSAAIALNELQYQDTDATLVDEDKMLEILPLAVISKFNLDNACKDEKTLQENISKMPLHEAKCSQNKLLDALDKIEIALSKSSLKRAQRIRLEVLIKRQRGEKIVTLKAENPKRNIERDIREAKSRDFPALKREFPDLPFIVWRHFKQE